MAKRIIAGYDVLETMNEIKDQSGHGKTDAQCMVWGLGYRGVQVLQSNYGWSVRSDSGLDNWNLIAGARQKQTDGSYEDAVQKARDWVAQDPRYRYAWTTMKVEE